MKVRTRFTVVTYETACDWCGEYIRPGSRVYAWQSAEGPYGETCPSDSCRNAWVAYYVATPGRKVYAADPFRTHRARYGARKVTP